MAPAELRGPDGDAFAYDYFLGDENALLIREENAATRDFNAIRESISSSNSPDEIESELNRRIAERLLERFRQWQQHER